MPAHLVSPAIDQLVERAADFMKKTGYNMVTSSHFQHLVVWQS